MTKKKLTKTQARRKMKQLNNIAYDLFADKFGHPDSLVPLTKTKLTNMNIDIANAIKRMK